MSRKVLDSNIGDADIDIIMNNIVAQNPQLNARIENVSNETNLYLCKVLRIYAYEDKGYVELLNTGEKVFCRLAHEIIGNGMSIDYLPKGLEKVDSKYYKDKRYIEPFSELYGILVKVRWNNLDDENVLIGYVNIYDDYDLRSSSDTGELNLKSGSSSISIDDERVNIMTPSLFINGLPYEEPELNNYYDKNETDIIVNSLEELINNIPAGELIDLSNYYTKDEINSLLSGSSGVELTDYVKKTDLIDNTKYDIDLNLNFGASGMDDVITIDMDIVDHIVNKTINTGS